MPVASRQRPPFKYQPINGRRLEINPAHWLAKRLIFAHTGRDALLYGEIVPPEQGGLPSQRGASTAAPGSPFEQGICFSGNDTKRLVYKTPSRPGIGITLHIWMARSGTAAVEHIFSSGTTAGISGGYNSIRISAGTTVEAISSTSGGSFSISSFVGGLSSPNAWTSACATFPDSSVRGISVNGAALNTASNLRANSTHNLISIGASMRQDTVTGSVDAAISGIALPLLIDGAFNDDEVSRLYIEQLTNPWALFRERPTQIWLGSAAAPTLPTLSAARAQPGSITSTGWVNMVTAS